MNLKISSRKSPLAQIQSFQVGETLQKSYSGIQIEYFFRQSLGDQNQHDPLWKMPEKGVFTEDFQKDLIEGATDMVVHSWKDLPTEEKKDTVVAATLARADQRDLMLFKKSSKRKKQIKLYSSSPRRTFNLQEFLKTALPWSVDAIEFHSVRGNISTRVQKLMADSEIDGLIVAKAALDRLLTDQKFPETQSQLKATIQELDWMVMPLSENPNAAAQGALGIEVARNNHRVLELLQKINHTSAFYCAQREREILKDFGGGCHLAIGVSVLERPYGRIEIVKGLTPEGNNLKTKKFFPQKSLPKNITTARLEFQSEREPVTMASLTNYEAIFVSRYGNEIPGLENKIVWSAGMSTWKKLAAQGIWVHGCAEGLGEQENPGIDNLMGRPLKWAYLTHETAAAQHGSAERIGTYSLHLSLKTETLPKAQAYRWKSGSELHLALAKFPELKKAIHICGPGRSFDTIKTLLGSDENIYVELGDEFISVI